MPLKDDTPRFDEVVNHRTTGASPPLSKGSSTPGQHFGMKRKQVKMPHKVPQFRVGKDAIEDPEEFMDSFKRIMRANGLDPADYARVLPNCMHNTDGKWFDTWCTVNDEEDWNLLERDFLQHFQNPNIDSVLQTLVRNLL